MVAIVAAQEFQWVFSAAKKTGSTVGVWFDWHKDERRVGIYYFYVLDPDFGPGFAVAGVAGVLVLPEVAPALPRGGDPEPNAPSWQLRRRAYSR